MPRGTKRKARSDKAAAPKAPSAPAPYNPLRDREKLSAAVARLAAAAVKQKRSMTAMEFCVEVLGSIGLRDVAVGQAERIFISGARKAALGAQDDAIIVKPAAAVPVVVPALATVAAALCEADHKCRGPDEDTVGLILPGCLNARLQRRLDVDTLRSRSLVHLGGFMSPNEAALIAKALAKDGGASESRATALRESSGTGRNGAYGDVHEAKVLLLRELKTALKAALCEQPCDQPYGKVPQQPGGKLVLVTDPSMLGDKVVVTRYAERGINYAHQDQSTGGYQAYLLLSRPGVDFRGGQLYLVDPAAKAAGAPDVTATRQVEWQVRNR